MQLSTFATLVWIREIWACTVPNSLVFTSIEESMMQHVRL